MASARPSKKQQELLSFVDGFIKGNGYGPSYREVMWALGYKSPSTVAAHIDALVAKGYLRKSGNYSARSIEVVGRNAPNEQVSHRQWLEQQLAKLLAEHPDDDALANVITRVRLEFGLDKSDNEKIGD
ncbi:MAG TPA: hypothetical protein VFQ70_01925 [Candidatus Saccharimonadaceae bacterium]|nr:hypothetical protein [Candidatus Saccharimonadaceae bacterium]